MIKKFTVFFLSLFSSLSGFSTIAVVTAGTANSYYPADITITAGDSVQFYMVNTHDALEVDQANYNVNGTTVLPGGFYVPYGGGLVLPDKLTPGIHYYICPPHAGAGMKGTINVLTNGVPQLSTANFNLNVFPNPCTDKVNVKYHIEQRSAVQVRISNILGSVITYITNDVQSAGDYELNYVIDRSNLMPGLYFLEFITSNKRSVQRLIVE